ncbi:hypothetical protein AIZ12_25640, partial [Salmonella enterica subsp. enterica serovar Typhimurium]
KDKNPIYFISFIWVRCLFTLIIRFDQLFIFHLLEPLNLCSIVIEVCVYPFPFDVLVDDGYKLQIALCYFSLHAFTAHFY